MFEQILDKEILYALILRKDFEDAGIQFFTPPEFSQQLGYMNRPKGYRVQAHHHEIQIREVRLTQEVLFIKKGVVRAMFYTNKGEKIAESILKSGDILMLVQGGHGFEMLEDSEIIEIKQGPYLGERDKKYFE